VEAEGKRLEHQRKLRLKHFLNTVQARERKTKWGIKTGIGESSERERHTTCRDKSMARGNLIGAEGGDIINL